MDRAQRQGWKGWPVIAVLLLAAAFRLAALTETPPGLAHDEVAHWLIARDILAGRHAIFFSQAYGQEPLYNYVLAFSVWLFGDHALALRWVSMAFGMLGLSASWALMRRMFGFRVAGIALALAAVSLWPIFYARVTYRGISLVAVAALAAYWMWRGVQRSKSGKIAWLPFLLAGVLFGLTGYTYLAARILPAILLIFLIYAWIIDADWRRPWLALLLMLALGLLINLPLYFYLRDNPDAQYRVGEVSAPLNALLSGDPLPALGNLWDCLRFFTIEGDPWPRQGIPGRPLFADPLSALLFYGGLLWSFWRIRETRMGFLLIWTIGGLGPSVATVIAPNSVRLILVMVTVFAYPALALDGLGALLDRMGVHRITRDYLPAGLIAMLVGGLTGYDYFLRWPADPVVRFDYQSGLTEAIQIRERQVQDIPVTIAGLSSDVMDYPTTILTGQRDTDPPRLSDIRQTMLIPVEPGALLLVPDVVPLDGSLGGWLLMEGMSRPARPENSSVTRYLLPSAAQIEASAAGSIDGLPVSFENTLTLLGLVYLPANPEVGTTDVYLSIWRVETAPPQSIKAFLHYIDASGQIVAQFDGLQSSPETWRSGDILIQVHPLALPLLPEAGPYTLRIGLYRPGDGSRLLLDAPASGDSLLLPAEAVLP